MSGLVPAASLRSGDARSDALPLRVAISTRALFDVEAEHAVFETEGVGAYVEAQRDREAMRMAKGVGFAAVSRLLALNHPGRAPVVEVVLVSRNAPEASLRTFASIDHYGLQIAAGSFTGGGAIAPLLTAWGIDLFLSKDQIDVDAAHALGVAAAKFGPGPDTSELDAGGDLRIAFDGDAVLFGDESELIYTREGLEAFRRHEADKAAQPMTAGPFGIVLRKIAALRDADRERGIRIALVTARAAPAHARAINTLRAWGTPVDEAHFVGEGDKSGIIEAFGAHIFFDDNERHVAAASRIVAAGQVPRKGACGRP